MQNTHVIVAALAAILLSACRPQMPEASSPLRPEASSPFRPVATLQDIMQSIIDPNIDYVWNAVATVSTVEGIDEKRPQSEEDWQAVRQHALTVLEAGNLLVMEGRAVAGPGANTSSGGAELSAPDIQRLVDANRKAFAARAHGLQDAVQQVIAAIDKKDVEAFEKAGGLVEQACEQCHAQFWYPNDKRPQ